MMRCNRILLNHCLENEKAYIFISYDKNVCSLFVCFFVEKRWYELLRRGLELRFLCVAIATHFLYCIANKAERKENGNFRQAFCKSGRSIKKISNKSLLVDFYMLFIDIFNCCNLYDRCS